MARRKKPKIVYLEGATSEPKEELWDNAARGEAQENEKKDTAPSNKKKIEPKEDVAEVSAGKKESVPEEQPLPVLETALESSGEILETQVVTPHVTTRKRPNWMLSAGLGIIMLVVLVAFIFIPLDKGNKTAIAKVQAANCLNIQPAVDWGYEFHTLTCVQGVLEEGRTLADVLLARRVDYKTIIQLTENAHKLGLPEILPGNMYTLLQPQNEPMNPYLLAYAPDAARYVLMNLKGEPAVKLYERQLLDDLVRQSEVAIQTTFAEAMYNREFGLKLARSMETALKYKLDFFHLDPGDRFSLLYAERRYEGDRKEIGDLDAVRYRHKGEEGYAFWFQDDLVKGYYDSEGRPMQAGYLKAPLEYGRISSPFNRRRPDPVSGSGKIMPHLGTDYAAPTGTPIIAVADGLVLKAEFRGGNGNYVKLLHTTEVQTQYLHMRNFAPGIKPGAKVRQGEVIGFVGSTGRSTGPHVCFRYWKNGEQVDHRKEKNLGAAPPLKGSSLAKFELRRDSLMRIFEPI
ncbi:MAG TPA: peptidase M23 [Bacteroidetes bacterium]|nr:peptidase M23 [Bacteroidota bacterium]